MEGDNDMGVLETLNEVTFLVYPAWMTLNWMTSEFEGLSAWPV